MKYAFEKPESVYSRLALYLTKRSKLTREILETLIAMDSPYTMEILRLAIDKANYNINKKNDEGQTLLTYSLKKYSESESKIEKLNLMKVVNCLLDCGIDVDIPDENGQTALHHCVFTNNLILFDELLGKHPNINATDALGKSPLFYLGNNMKNPMRIAFDIYAKKRNIIPVKFKI